VKIVAETVLRLPFSLDLCAVGPSVPVLRARRGQCDITIDFPPSLSEGTDGKGIFGDWAWWTADRLHVTIEMDAESDSVPDALRAIAIDAADEALRRLLNACRDRFDRPDIRPVRLNERDVALAVVEADGTRRPLPEPAGAFFYQNMPDAPPLAVSINATTIDELARAVEKGPEPPLARQLELDAMALDDQGEYLRAEILRDMARMQL
jgi:hypothetical protein